MKEKDLNDMTNEELWMLFPIIISEHQPYWKELYLSEKDVIEKTVGLSNITRINHIGSTAVSNLVAKPTIDILLEISDSTDLNKLKGDIESIGYVYSYQPNNPAPHMMFMKGYTAKGFQGQAYHLHVRYRGDWDEIYFRDYLITHPKVAKEYGALKLQLKEQYKHDRDGYTQAKSDFIRKITELAREIKSK